MGYGSKLYNKYKFLIIFTSKLLGIFPRTLRMTLWNGCNNISGKIGVGIRYCLLRSLAKHCGDNVFIGKGVELIDINNLSIGSNVSIHKNCYIDSSGSITIGDNVSIAHNSSLLSFEHTWEDKSLPIKYNKLIHSPVFISDDVWIGCGCRILAGVTLGYRTIVAAGAVVVKGGPGNEIIGGVPAKKIKEI